MFKGDPLALVPAEKGRPFGEFCPLEMFGRPPPEYWGPRLFTSDQYSGSGVSLHGCVNTPELRQLCKLYDVMEDIQKLLGGFHQEE